MSSNRSSKQPPSSSAISQISRLKPIPGIDGASTPEEDITQRPVGRESNRQSQPNSMKEIDPKSTRHSPVPQSQMSSVMGDSAMGSTIRPLDLNQQTPEESSDGSTVFVKTKAVRRPAVVREPNNWIKKQTIDMTRSVPLGVQPSDVEAKKLLHSHTGVPSRTSSKTAVSDAPASSPTPLPTASTSNTKNDALAEQLQPRRKTSSHQTAREKKSVQVARTKRSTAPLGVSKSAPSSPTPYEPPAASSGESIIGPASTSQSHLKESTSIFSKFAKKLLPSTSNRSNATSGRDAGQQQQPPAQRSKSAASIFERKQQSKPKGKK